MIKKFLSLILAVMLFAMTAGTAQAILGGSPDARIKSEVFSGSDGTSQAASSITSRNRIWGFRVTGSAAAIGALHDAAATSSVTTSTLFDESACLATDSIDVWYPAPKALTNGLCVDLNASTTVVVVYYE